MLGGSKTVYSRYLADRDLPDQSTTTRKLKGVWKQSFGEESTDSLSVRVSYYICRSQGNEIYHKSMRRGRHTWINTPCCPGRPQNFGWRGERMKTIRRSCKSNYIKLSEISTKRLPNGHHVLNTMQGRR